MYIRIYQNIFHSFVWIFPQGLCIFSLLTIFCSAVQFENQQSQSPADYDYDSPEGRHLHGGLLKKKKKLKKEFKRKKKVLANCLLNSKFKKRSLNDTQQRAAWSEEQKAAVNEIVLQRIKRDRPQGRFLIPIPFAVQYTNVQTGGGGGGHYGGGGSSSSSSSSGDDEDYGGDSDCDAGSDSERYSDRFVGPYHSNDVYRQLYKSFMRWVLWAVWVFESRF